MSKFLRRRSARTQVPRSTNVFASYTLSTILAKAKRFSVGPSLSNTGDDSLYQYPVNSSVETRSSTSSDRPSLEDIRRPSGLGQRAETESECSLDTVGSVHQAVLVNIHAEHTRLTSISQEDSTLPCRLSIADTANSSIPFTDPLEIKSLVAHLPPAVPIRCVEFPREILGAVLAFLSRHDLLSVARVSTSFLVEARKALYELIDLREFPPERVDDCVATFASRRDLATLIRSFTSPKLPSFYDDSPSVFLTYSIALYNMPHLTSLSLPRFDAVLFQHTTLRLEQATFWCETMSETEQEQFSNWLAKQTELTSIAFPALITDFDIASVSQKNVSIDLTAINFEEQPFPTSSPAPTLLVAAKLKRFQGPPCLAMSLIPGRPVSEVVLHIQNTLYDGLKPSELTACLAKSATPITKLSIIPISSIKIDARSLERVLISAGTDIGLSVQTLEVEWLLEEHSLYKNIAFMVSRFKNLKMLHLRKATGLPLSRSWTPSSGYITPASSTSTVLPLTHCFSVSPTHKSKSESISSFQVLDTRECREHKYLKKWTKACSSLKTVVFLGGAEWCVVRRRKRVAVPQDMPVNVLSFIGWRLED